MGLSEWWALVSGRPHHGWHRLAHSGVVALAFTVALAKLAERIVGMTSASASPAVWAGIDPPDGMTLAWKVVRPGGRTYGRFCWPFQGDVECAAKDIIKRHRGACPSRPGDGLCLAKTWAGAASGEIPASTGLAIAYRPSDVLGEDEQKLRVSACRVLAVLDLHRLIRDGHAENADLSCADLRGADLAGANLSEADLHEANLAEANLSQANLSRANLAWANLVGARLHEANLAGAGLHGANLTQAHLRWANLSGTNLTLTDIYGMVDLSEAIR